MHGVNSLPDATLYDKHSLYLRFNKYLYLIKSLRHCRVVKFFLPRISQDACKLSSFDIPIGYRCDSPTLSHVLGRNEKIVSVSWQYRRTCKETVS